MLTLLLLLARPSPVPPPAIEHFLRAEILRYRGDRAQAEAELRYALAFDHDSLFLRARLAELQQ